MRRSEMKETDQCPETRQNHRVHLHRPGSRTGSTACCRPPRSSGSAPGRSRSRPRGAPRKSMSGFRLTPDRSADPGGKRRSRRRRRHRLRPLGWPNDASRSFAPCCKAVAARGGVVGGICAGTLALARAGLFENAGTPATAATGSWSTSPTMPARRITRTCRTRSPMAGSYRPRLRAGTFALAFLKALYPDRKALAEMKSCSPGNSPRASRAS